MRHINEYVLTFEVQEDIELLKLKKGDKLRYQGSVSNNTLFFLRPEGTINKDHFFSKNIIDGREDLFKSVPNFTPVAETAN